MNKSAKICVAGHREMVGCAIVRRVQAGGWTARIRLEEGIRTTYDWFRQNLPEKGDA